MVANLLGESRGARGQELDVFGHARLVDVGVDGLGAEQHGVVAPTEEIQDGILDRREGERLARHELPKR